MTSVCKKWRGGRGLASETIVSTGLPLRMWDIYVHQCLHKREPCGFSTFFSVSVATNVTARDAHVTSPTISNRDGTAHGVQIETFDEKRRFLFQSRHQFALKSVLRCQILAAIFAMTTFASENHVIAMWSALFEQALTSVLSKLSGGKWAFKIEARRWLISRTKEII